MDYRAGAADGKWSGRPFLGDFCVDSMFPEGEVLGCALGYLADISVKYFPWSSSADRLTMPFMARLRSGQIAGSFIS